MTSRILTLFTRTPLHVGAGASVGAIDQPIVRERHTGFPIIPGSSLKGVLADAYLNSGRTERTAIGRRLFGHEKPDADGATSGSLSFGEAKILLFPVRSTNGCFAWATSPLALRRWASATNEHATPPMPANGTYLGDATKHGDNAVFEDTLLSHAPKTDWIPASLAKHFKQTAPAFADILSNHAILVADAEFAHLCTSGTEIASHNRIDDQTGVVADGALFNCENVPAEALFFSTIHELRPGALNDFSVPKIIQLGGDATTGLGFCDCLLS